MPVFAQAAQPTWHWPGNRSGWAFGLGRVCAALSLVLPVVLFLSVPVGGAFAMHVRVSCPLVDPVAPQTPPEMAQTICREMIARLAETYPDVTFTADGPAGDLALAVQIHAATASVLRLRLIWTKASGHSLSGEEMAILVSDRALNPALRSRLYTRAIIANPLPCAPIPIARFDTHPSEVVL